MSRVTFDRSGEMLVVIMNVRLFLHEECAYFSVSTKSLSVFYLMFIFSGVDREILWKVIPGSSKKWGGNLKIEHMDIVTKRRLIASLHRLRNDVITISKLNRNCWCNNCIRNP